MKHQPVLVFSLLALLARVCLAHEFWLQPDAFRAAPGASVAVALFVGKRFAGDSVPYIPDWIESVELLGPADRRTLAGEVGDDPALRFQLDRPGTYLVSYQSRPESSEIDPDRFQRYLLESGHAAIHEQRVREGKAQRSVSESYVRCAKTLVNSGAAAGSHVTRPVGLPLELVPLQNPYALADGEALRLTVRYRGEPLAGALIRAFPQSDPEQLIEARADEDGQVSLRLPRGKIWLLNTVKIIPGNGDVTEWFSYWASLTFAL